LWRWALQESFYVNGTGEQMGINEPKPVRILLILITIISLCTIVVVPMTLIIFEALSKGFDLYLQAITQEESLNALKLSVFAAAISVCLNLVFGLSIGWALGKFKVPGSKILIGLIELPLSISPVIAGLTFILLLGKYSAIGGWLDRNGIDIIFAVPGVVLATIFVTFPFIAREVIPLMKEAGNDEEEAALLLGAGGLRTFFRVTLPNIKWGVIYGLLITNARAMGEFGAVSVVSGHLRNKTTTLTLQVEMLYNEYNFSESFAVASLLIFLALLTLFIKAWIEWKKPNKALPK
jgi:sulfate transport system permease protein